MLTWDWRFATHARHARDALRPASGFSSKASPARPSAWTPPRATTRSPNVDVLFLVRQDRAARSQLPAEELEGTLEEGAHKIMEAVVRRNESQGEPYRLSWQVATANRVPADAILYRYHPLDLEVG